MNEPDALDRNIKSLQQCSEWLGNSCPANPFQLSKLAISELS